MLRSEAVRIAGRFDLTPILCAWDMGWQDVANAPAKPIRVDILTSVEALAFSDAYANRVEDVLFGVKVP